MTNNEQRALPHEPFIFLMSEVLIKTGSLNIVDVCLGYSRWRRNSLSTQHSHHFDCIIHIRSAEAPGSRQTGSKRHGTMTLHMTCIGLVKKKCPFRSLRGERGGDLSRLKAVKPFKVGPKLDTALHLKVINEEIVQGTSLNTSDTFSMLSLTLVHPAFLSR